MSSFGEYCRVCKEPKVDGFCHCDAPERLRRPKSQEEKDCQVCSSALQMAFLKMYPEVKWSRLCKEHQADLAAGILKMEEG